MTSNEWDDAYRRGAPWPDLCVKVHPSEPVRCALLPASNAATDDGEPVHIHKGIHPGTGETFRWEDAPADSDPEHAE